MKTLTIIGRRWFQRGPGNTYHTAQIIVDGKTLAKTSMQYGYGDHYLQTASEYLEDCGLLPSIRRYPNGSVQPLRQYCGDNGTAFESIAMDVQRQKDL